MDLFPFIPRDDITIDQLEVNGTTLIAAALGKIVLYAADATGRSAPLILETGDLDFSTAGLKEANQCPAVGTGTATLIAPPSFIIRKSRPACTAGFFVARLRAERAIP